MGESQAFQSLQHLPSRQTAPWSPAGACIFAVRCYVYPSVSSGSICSSQQGDDLQSTLSCASLCLKTAGSGVLWSNVFRCTFWILPNNHVYAHDAKEESNIWKYDLLSGHDLFPAQTAQPAGKPCLLIRGSEEHRGPQLSLVKQCLRNRSYLHRRKPQGPEMIRSPLWVYYGFLKDSSIFLHSTSPPTIIILYSCGEEQIAKKVLGSVGEKEELWIAQEGRADGYLLLFPGSGQTPSSICWNRDQTARSGDSRVREIKEL